MNQNFLSLGLLLATIFALTNCQKGYEVPEEQTHQHDFAERFSSTENYFQHHQINFDDARLIDWTTPDGKTRPMMLLEDDVLMSVEAYEEAYAAATAEETAEGNQKHYRANNIVGLGEYVIAGIVGNGSIGMTAAQRTGLERAIANYNELTNFGVSFVFGYTSNINLAFQVGDIVIFNATNLDETIPSLAVATFPAQNGGAPGPTIGLNGPLIAQSNLSKQTMEELFTHEIGHCLGMRHTDWFDRSISCGGASVSENQNPLGAQYIAGTPAMNPADFDEIAESVWSACIDPTANGNFSPEDRTALRTLFPQ